MNYNEYMQLNTIEKNNYFIDTLSVTNRTPEYYVNWIKVVDNTLKYELELNTLNYLIGKENIYNEALSLFRSQPNLLKAVPSLIASRDRNLDILIVENEELSVSKLDFNKIDTNRIVEYINFMNNAGVLNFLSKNANKSLVDYVYGVESGIDSNARKNRSGSTMESILTSILKKISLEYDMEHLEQASASLISNKWKINVPVDKSMRRFDGALYDPKINKVYVFETNYYGGGGSKLKSVAGEFQTLNKLILSTNENVEFVWVTDGQGWKTAKIPMLEAMGSIKNILNLKMIEQDFLFDILKLKSEK